MKAIIVFLVSIMLLSVVGCSNMGPVSVNEEVSTSTAFIAVSMVSPTALGKKLAYSSTANKLVVATTPARANGAELDTFDITGLTAKSFSISGFVRNQSYVIQVFTLGDSCPFRINYGDSTVVIPDSSSFSLSMVLGSGVKNIKGSVTISGTPAFDIANRICVIWKSMDLGSGKLYIDSLDTVFTPKTLSSFPISSVLPIRPENLDGLTTYDVEVYIYCTDEGFYKGASSVDLSPSADQPLNIVLTKFGGIYSLAKIVVQLVPITNLNFSTSFAD